MHLSSRVLAAAILLCGGLCAPPSPAQTSAAPPARRSSSLDGERLRAFEELVRAQMEREHIPGLTVGFFRGEEMWVKGFGYADLEQRVPATADSVYRLASVTKPMTAVAVLQLVEQGRIKLDEEIQTYVPGYPKQKWPVTVRQLLSHLGGGQSGSGLGAEHKSVREVVELITKAGLANEPGTKFVYTTSGYNLLGAAVEHASGQSFADYMRERVWLPAGMTETRVDDPRQLIPRRVRGYEKAGGKVQNAPVVDVSTRFGGGGASGTVPDVLRFARALHERRLLKSDDLIAQMYAPAASRDGRFMNMTDDGWDYSLGWFISSRNGRFALQHDGGQKGTATALLYIPSENFAVAVACNADWPDKWFYVRKLLEAVFDEPWEVRVRTKDKPDAALFRALKLAYDFGALHYDKTAAPLTSDPQELARAFAYFNRAVERKPLLDSYDEALKLIDDGRHPAAEQSFVKVGSYVAARLAERHGRERLASYRRRGAIAFFGDYLELYEGDARHPAGLRLAGPLAQTVSRWHADWARVWNDDTRRIRLAPGADYSAVAERLRQSFAGAEVVPDLIGELLTTSVAAFHRGERESALRTASLAADLYPQDEFTNFIHALNLVASGETARAREALRKALAANPSGVASPARLRQNASELSAVKKSDEALGLLLLGVELHPHDAGLHEATADALTRKGQKERAEEFYRKARALKEGRATR